MIEDYSEKLKAGKIKKEIGEHGVLLQEQLFDNSTGKPYFTGGTEWGVKQLEDLILDDETQIKELQARIDGHKASIKNRKDMKSDIAEFLAAAEAEKKKEDR